MASGNAAARRTIVDLRGRTEAALRLALPALLGYGAARFLGIALLYYLAKRRGESPGRALYGSWDAQWYQMIAERGYDRTIHGVPHTWHFASSNLAFFPLYPALCRGADLVLPVGLAKSSWLVSMAASLAAAWLIFLIGNRLYGRRTGIILAVLWGCLPHAVVESMAYTESLFTALCAAALLAALTRRWVLAGLFAALAGLTRPTGIAIAAAISLCAALALVQGVRARGRGSRGGGRPGGPRSAGCSRRSAGWRSWCGWACGCTARTATSWCRRSGGTSSARAAICCAASARSSSGRAAPRCRWRTSW